MKYFKVEFRISGPTELLSVGRDLLAALAGQAGFEAFQDSISLPPRGELEGATCGLCGYVQQSLFSDEALRQAVASLPLPGVSVDYEVTEADDRDWNEQWEQEGFDPIVLGGRLVIHDGHCARRFCRREATAPIQVEIDARQAFGTGNHATTRLMCRRLLDIGPQGKRVLDCGCGTGILSIVALKAGACHCLAYDIDQWSTDNARHNAIINGVDNRLDVRLGDATLLSTLDDERFDILLANINRNILLADMEAMSRVMASGARLLLSGFYQADVPMLQERARQLGLSVVDSQSDGQWAQITLAAF